MTNRLILFGAGASFASDDSGTPPLGSELIHALRQFNPPGWGALPDDLVQSFSPDFERGMRCLSEQHSHWMPPLQRAMGAYFFRFVPRPSNLYIALARRIHAVRWHGALTSLNYERLLELSLVDAGLHPVVGRITSPSQQVELCLPHGCCHLFCDSVKGSSRAITFSGTAVSTSGAVRPVSDPTQFQHRIESDAFPPVMSYFEPKKRTSSGVNFIRLQRERWRELALSASTVAVVGVKVRPHDDHIWEPLAQTNATIVYCSGKSAARQYFKWSNDVRPNTSDIILEDYFRESFDDLCVALGLNT